MSRGGTKQLDPSLCGHVPGNQANDGYTASVTVDNADNMGTDGITGAGDLLILTHVVDSAATGIGTPNTVGNAWTPLAKPDGTPLDETVTSTTGTIRMRMWWKLTTQAEYTTPATYTVTNTFKAHPGLVVRIIPASALGQGALPPQIVVRTGSDNTLPYGPALTEPNRSGTFRDVGLVGSIIGYQVDITRSVFTNARSYLASYDPKKWRIDRPVFTGADNPITSAVRCDTGLTLDPLHGQASPEFCHLGGGTNTPRLNVPFVAVTFMIPPYTYPAGTTGATWSELATDFTDPAVLTGYDTIGSPTVTGGELVLPGGSGLLRKDRIDFTRQSLVVEVDSYDPTGGSAGTGALQVMLVDGSLGTASRTAIVMATHFYQGAPIMTGAVVDDGFGGTYISFGPVAFAGDVDPGGGGTRWWRIREEAGFICFDTSADRSRWRTALFLPHTLLADQLACLRVGIVASGTPSTTPTAKIGTINPSPAIGGVASLPFDSTNTYLGMTDPVLRETWHGRDVLVGIVDTGSTKEARAPQQVTLKRRGYFFPPPAGGAEIYPGSEHGCLTMTCGVPHGGQHMEAVVFDGGESTTIDVVMAGILYCAVYGSKVINCSIGGGGDDPAISVVFDWIAANYDCEIFCSTGNDYSYGIATPAVYSTVYDNVHSVGAFDEFTNTRAPFSNHHELMSGVAPGQDTGGRLPDGSPVTWNGTSASAPHATQVGARLCTGGRAPGGKRWSAGQAGVAMNRGARDTGASRSDQGNGAFDLARSIAILGDPIGGANVPLVAMPRFELDQKLDVADGFNVIARAVELQGSVVVLHYRPIDADTKLPTIAGLPSSTWGVLAWTEAEADSSSAMWPFGGSIVVAPESGMYLVLMQVRFGTKLVDGSTATGSPYNAGQRAAAIMLNGTDIAADSVALELLDATAVGEGNTIAVGAILPLEQDDFVYGMFAQNSGALVQCAQDDYGGTWFAMARLSPLAPAL